MPTERAKDLGLRFIACFVVLWTPYFFFSSYRGHPIPATALLYSALVYAAPAIVLSLAIGPNKGWRRVAIFGLLVCLFLDLQVAGFGGALAWVGAAAILGAFWLVREHLALIVACVFGTILLSSLITPSGGDYVDHAVVTETTAKESEPRADGRIVHLILDEFASAAGLPESVEGGEELRSELVEFFRAHEFSLEPEAISEYASSRYSISGILNFEASSQPDRLVHGKRPYVLERNAYFEALDERGFDVHVHQSTYMDFCRESPVPVASCFTYRYDGTDWLREAKLSDWRKMEVLLGMVLNLPGFLESVSKGLVGLHEATRRIGLGLPKIMTWDGILAPISTMAILDEYRASVIDSPEGSAHFAHLMLPHSPYVYDSECNLVGRPLRWLSHHPLHTKDNTPEGRALRYPQYFSQVRCTLRQLERFFDELKTAGIWEETELILHGDHGSRLYVTAPRAKFRDRLDPPDLSDAFRTIFAVKTSDSRPRAMDSVVPISRLLAEVAGSVLGDGEAEPDASVYLEGQNDEDWMEIPWQDEP